MANIIADIHKWDTWHLNIGLKRELDYFFQSVSQTQITNADFSFNLLYFFMIAWKIILVNGQRHIFNFSVQTDTLVSEIIDILF